MKKEKLISLDELKELSLLKYEVAKLSPSEAGGGTYLLITNKKNDVPHEFYCDVLQQLNQILRDKNIDHLILDGSAFESLKIYEINNKEEIK